MKQWIVTGRSMVVEAETEEEAVDRAQETSGWHWEADEVYGGGSLDETDPHDDDGNRLTPAGGDDWPEETAHDYAEYASPSLLRDHLVEHHGFVPQAAAVLYTASNNHFHLRNAHRTSHRDTESGGS